MAKFFEANKTATGATPQKRKNVQLTDSRPHPHWAGRAAAHMTRFAFAYAVLGVVLLSMGGPSGAALLSPSAELCRGAQRMRMAGVCIGGPTSLPLWSASVITGIHLPLSALLRAVRMAARPPFSGGVFRSAARFGWSLSRDVCHCCRYRFGPEYSTYLHSKRARLPARLIMEF